MIPSVQFAHLIEQYPEFVTQKQMCEICNFCQKTAYNITRRGEITFSRAVDEHGSHNSIRLTDIIAYLTAQAFRQAPDTKYLKELRQFFSEQLVEEPDVFATLDVVRITGFSKSAVTGWVRSKRLQILDGNNKKFWIPKEYLLDFLAGNYFHLIKRKSDKQIAYMQKFEQWLNVCQYEEGESNGG